MPEGLWDCDLSRKGLYSRTSGVACSDYMERFSDDLVKNVLGQQIQIMQNCLNIGVRVCGDEWSGIVFSKKLFCFSSPYIVEINDIQLVGEIMYKYIIESYA